MRALSLFLMVVITTNCMAQKKIEVPASYSNIKFDKKAGLILEYNEEVKGEISYVNPPQLASYEGNIKGFAKGLFFDFNDSTLNGNLIYGFIPYGDSKHPHPVYRSASSKIMGGRTTINIADIMSGRYDMIDWESTGRGTIGYRVVQGNGRIMYDGKVSFEGTGPFKVVPTVIEGPFVNLLQSDGATISLVTSMEAEVSLSVDNKIFKSESGLKHEIKVEGLKQATVYDYTVSVGNLEQSYSFTTAPSPGSRSSFSFAYASDSRSGNGGGERAIYGANAYIMKKIMALGRQQGVSFMQFTGDLINGYVTSPEDIALQYRNWKNAVSPFASYFPIISTMGNHEALMTMFEGPAGGFRVDKFPFETQSAEAVFADNFVNPLNGPDSEDGSQYDPSDKTTDFPSYKENVFYYTYDNIGVVVLNSDYWYAASSNYIPITSGNLHGYIMDNQLDWLKETIATLESDENIDHVFITQHTPAFPNGGHVGDDMWYRGNNAKRPYIAGEPVEKGIIERRDEYLDAIINNSTKVVAILTGDEHNYARTEVGPNTTIYDDKLELPKLELKRTVWQINNGAAGAPYYAQEETPWTASVSGFTTQHALVIFHVNGKSLTMEVLNPDTLEKFDELKLR